MKLDGNQMFVREGTLSLLLSAPLPDVTEDRSGVP